MTIAPESLAAATRRRELPRHGVPADTLLAELKAMKADDIDYRDGRVAGLVYLMPDDVQEIARAASNQYFSENALSARAFPSLGRLERETVEMSAALMNGGPEATGCLTSGGSESITIAVKSARDRARALHPHITEPEIVCGFTAHAAFSKAAHYFGLKVTRVPVRDDDRLHVEDIRAALTPNTVLIVGSAPSYPYGMVDPIPELAALAVERNINMHVDACVGGFYLPFLERIGEAQFPAWDFRVPGVTTMSADLHKFGYTAKGASVVLSRDEEVFSHQGYTFADWPSGIYKTPSVTGTRPAGPIAAAWAVMNYLGEDGYARLCAQTVAFTKRLWAGIEAIPGLKLRGQPDMCCFAYYSTDPALDIWAVADGLERRGYFAYRERQPKGIHLMLSVGHDGFVDRYLEDLRQSVAEARQAGEAVGKEARYG